MYVHHHQCTYIFFPFCILSNRLYSIEYKAMHSRAKFLIRKGFNFIFSREKSLKGYFFPRLASLEICRPHGPFLRLEKAQDQPPYTRERMREVTMSGKVRKGKKAHKKVRPPEEAACEFLLAKRAGVASRRRGGR